MVSQKVKEILKKDNMSQKDLCNLTGISESAMSKYLSSCSIPRTEILLKFAKALNVSIDYLLDRESNDQDTFTTCKTALLARSGKKLSESEKRELVNLILGD